MSLTQILDSIDEPKPSFGNYHEEGIISLSLDYPEFFSVISRFIKPEMFDRPECRKVMALILDGYQRHNVIPTRALLYDMVSQAMTTADNFEPVLAVIRRESDHREIPFLKDSLLKWAREKAYGLIYDEETMEAYQRGDYETIEKVLTEASKITDIGEGGFWFFENMERLFQNDVVEHRTTGFPQLDKMLNNGGPSPKEVVCYLAPTNVGKSIILCQTAISSVNGIGKGGVLGQNVLLVTFELDTIKTAMRIMASASGVATDELAIHKDMITRLLTSMQRNHGKRIHIHEFAPEECSVDHIYALIDNLKRQHNFSPDVIILDYMDLMVSRVASYNKDDYNRQKHVASEIRGLAKNTNSLVFTATQTNRSGAEMGENEFIEMTKSAESFGKQFSMDYVISLNQSRQDRASNPPKLTLYIAKNRNGPKNEAIHCSIKYEIMQVRESAQ